MLEVEFLYGGKKIDIQCKSEEKMEEIINRFLGKAGKTKEQLFFIYGGEIVNENLTLNSQANDNDKKRNKMSILVNNKTEDYTNDEQSLKKSQYIICPECKESSRIKVDNYKIGFYDCKNGHNINDILINDFDQTQNIDEAKIICQNCNKINKSTSYKNIFFLCYDCKKNLCSLCQSIHDTNHNLIDYDERFFFCDSHYELYFSYCKDCKKDICLTCEGEHSNHETISYGSILPNLENIKEETNNFNEKKEAFKNDIREIINKLNNLIYTIDNYFEIYQDIINSYAKKKRNYSLLQNINEISKCNEAIIKDINEITNEKNIYEKIKGMITIYNKSIEINKSHNKNNELPKKENQNDCKKKMGGNLAERMAALQARMRGGDGVTDNKNDIKEVNSEKKRIFFNNEELFIASEKRENSNYTDFNISQITKILTIKTRYEFLSGIFILNDGRIIVYGTTKNDFNYLFSVFDLKNKDYFEFNFKVREDEEEYENCYIIQMDDGIVIIGYGIKIRLINVKKNSFKIISTLVLNSDSGKIIKLSNQKILMFTNEGISKYKYENKKLILVKDKKLNTMKKLLNIEYDSICAINEEEIAIKYEEKKFIGSNKNCIGFFDIEKDEKNASFELSQKTVFSLINENLFIFSDGYKLYPILLKKYNKLKEFKIDSGGDINIIFPLNIKQFIVAQKYYIKQYEFENNKIEFINSIKVYNYAISKYPKNRLIFRGDEYNAEGSIIYLYG